MYDDELIYSSMTPAEKLEWKQDQLRKLKERQIVYGEYVNGKPTFKYLDGSKADGQLMKQENRKIRSAAQEILKDENETNNFMYARDIEKYFGNHFSAVGNKIIGPKKPIAKVPKKAADNVNQFVKKVETARRQGQTAIKDDYDINANRKGLDTVVYYDPLKTEKKEPVEFGDPETWDQKVPEFMQKNIDPDSYGGIGSMSTPNKITEKAFKQLKNKKFEAEQLELDLDEK